MLCLMLLKRLLASNIITSVTVDSQELDVQETSDLPDTDGWKYGELLDVF